MLTPAEQELERQNASARTETGFWFNGVHSTDFYLYVENFPVQRTPRRKVETLPPVPGRTGDLHFTQDAFENITQSYACYFHSPKQMPEQAKAVKEWLLGAKDGAWLQDAYMQGKRWARFVGPMDIENYDNRFGRCVIHFDCSPQIYLPDSMEPVRLSRAGSIQGNAYPWLPLIKVSGSGAGKLTVGSCTVDLLDIQSEIILDSELQDAYRILTSGAKDNANADVHAPNFPVIQGPTAISWSGGVRRVEITPRGWTL